MKNKEGRLIWADIETTGLDQVDNMQGIFKHAIIEVAVLITDDNFNILGDGFEIIINQPEEKLKLMSDFVTDMHTKSGLLDKVRNSPFSLSTAENMIVSYLESQGVEKSTAPLCGNNIKFDRNFISAQMPELNSFFHYRNLDVSSVKEIARRTHPDVFESVSKKMSHRALDDIKESIEELKHYQKHMFKAPSVPKSKLKP